VSELVREGGDASICVCVRACMCASACVRLYMCVCLSVCIVREGVGGGTLGVGGEGARERERSIMCVHMCIW